MLPLLDHDAVRRSQKPHISHSQAGLFGDFSARAGLEGLAVFEVAAGEGQRSWQRRLGAFTGIWWWWYPRHGFLFSGRGLDDRWN